MPLSQTFSNFEQTTTPMWMHHLSSWRHEMETFSALLALCAGNSLVPVNSPHKGQWCGALMFSLICIWINGWVNNREAGDLRRHRGRYDGHVMITSQYGTILLNGGSGNGLVLKRHQAIVLALYYYNGLMMSLSFQPMAVQLSLKAVLPLAKSVVIHGPEPMPLAYGSWTLCPDSIWRCCLTSIGNPIVEIRPSYDHLICW